MSPFSLLGRRLVNHGSDTLLQQSLSVKCSVQLTLIFALYRLLVESRSIVKGGKLILTGQLDKVWLMLAV